MNKPIIAIQRDHQQLSSKRWQSFSTRWHELAAQQGVTTLDVDIFSNSANWLDQLKNCDGFMWWFAQPLSVSRPGRRLITSLAHLGKIPTFPNLNTIWHFDDKAAQSYLLQLADIPTPVTWVFWSKSQAREFIESVNYPLVLKLSSGVISKNVELVRTRHEAHQHLDALFDSGMYALPPANLPWRWFVRRTSEAMRVFFSEPTDEEFHKGYLLLQEFLPGNDFDIRITVIGKRAFAFRRFNRPGDFRASGSGRIDWDPTGIPKDALLLAFRTASVLQTQSLAVDVLRRNSKPVIAEISYYYEGWAITECPGHWELSTHASEPVWIEGSIQPEDAIWEDFVTRLGSRSNRQNRYFSMHR